MSLNEHFDQETDRTLRALEGIERAEPRLFFFTRVQARLAQSQAARASGPGAFRPALLAAWLGVVLLLNVSAVVVYQYQLTAQEQAQAAESFADEWGADPATLDWEQP
jgi:hypothetical protein